MSLFSLSGGAAGSGSGGAGDVVGPASSTDNSIALFDGITGKLLKAGVTTLSPTTGAATALRFTVTPHTSDTAVASSESFSVHTNDGAAGAVVLTLPVLGSGTAGVVYIFYLLAAQNLDITARSGDRIQLGTTGLSADAGFIRSATVGAAAALIALNSSRWGAFELGAGPWTIDS